MPEHFINYLIKLQINLTYVEIDDYEEQLVALDEDLSIVRDTKWNNYAEFKQAFNGVNSIRIRIIEKQMKLLGSIGDLSRRLR